MRKMLYLLLLLAFFTSSVSADVLWEPYENEYYMENYEDAVFIAEKYEVPEGMTVNIYTKPNGEVIKTLNAGTVVYVGLSMEVDGETWAAGYPLGEFDTEGWFRLSRLQKQYNHHDFTVDYAESIVSVNGEMKANEIGCTVYTWTYPGSGVLDGKLEQELLDSETEYNDGMVSYSLEYTDPNGGKWGYIGYHMGHCGWMYLDDPGNAEPDFVLDAQPQNTVTDTTPSEDVQDIAADTTSQAENDSKPVENEHADLTIPILVGAVVIVTAVLIIILKKKAK